MIFYARATRGLRRPSFDARSEPTRYTLTGRDRRPNKLISTVVADLIFLLAEPPR